MHDTAQDREKNKRIAEHLLGWTDLRLMFGHWAGKNEHGIPDNVPAFCTDDDDALRLVLWMQHHGSSLTLNWGEDTDAWECSWITGGLRFTGCSVYWRGAVIAVAEQAIDAKRLAGIS